MDGDAEGRDGGGVSGCGFRVRRRSGDGVVVVVEVVMVVVVVDMMCLMFRSCSSFLWFGVVGDRVGEEVCCDSDPLFLETEMRTDEMTELER